MGTDLKALGNIFAMRILLAALLLAAANACGAASLGDLRRAVTDDQLLKNAGVEPSAALRRFVCDYALYTEGDPPEFESAICVQTAQSFYIFTLESDFLMQETQLNVRLIDGVGLRKYGRNRQVHLFDRGVIYVVYVPGTFLVDVKGTEAMYQALIDGGATPHAPAAFVQ